MSEVFTGKSQTSTLLLLSLGQTCKVKVRDFPVKTEHLKSMSCYMAFASVLHDCNRPVGITGE